VDALRGSSGFARAARNVLHKGIGMERAEYTPVREGANTQLSDVGRVASMKQEVHLFRGG